MYLLRACVLTCEPVLFPPCGPSSNVAAGSTEMSPPPVSNHLTVRPPGARPSYTRAADENAMSWYEGHDPQADDSGSDRSCSQRYASVGCEDREKAWCAPGGSPHPNHRGSRPQHKLPSREERRPKVTAGTALDAWHWWRGSVSPESKDDHTPSGHNKRTEVGVSVGCGDTSGPGSRATEGATRPSEQGP